MADLIAIAYPNEETANDVVRSLARLQSEKLIELDDAVAIRRDADGKVKLDQRVDLTSLGALAGALWGGLIGILFFAPLLGLVAGTAAGALGGRFADYGIDDRFVKELGAQLKPDSAAVVLLVRRATEDKVLDEMRKYGGTVIRSSLTHEAEQRLDAALQQRATT